MYVWQHSLNILIKTVTKIIFREKQTNNKLANNKNKNKTSNKQANKQANKLTTSKWANKNKQQTN